MGELILHIGATKTGSSALQRFFVLNRESLLRSGVAFPDFDDLAKKPPGINGRILTETSWNLARGADPAENEALRSRYLERLKAAVSAHPRVLISDEHFSTLHTALPGTSFEDSFRAYWGSLAEAIAFAGPSSVTAVFYARRQDERIASTWREEVRSGWCGTPFDEFVTWPLTLFKLDYCSLISMIEDSLKMPVSMKIRLYDRGSFAGGDIFSDFLDAAGISADAAPRRPFYEPNPSVTYDVAEALRGFYEAAPPDSPLRESALIPAALKLSGQRPDKAGITPFDESGTRSFMQQFLEGNRSLSERYMDGRPLFSEKYSGRPHWEADRDWIEHCCKVFERESRLFNRFGRILGTPVMRKLRRMAARMSSLRR